MLALLSNVTIESVADKVAELTGEKIYISPGYNTWMQDLMSADFAGEKPQAVFVLLEGTELFGDSFPKSIEEAKQIVEQYVAVIKNFSGQHKDIPIFVSSLDIPQKRIQPFVSKHIEQEVAAYWRDLLEDASIPILEIADIVANVGREKFYSSKMWYLGSMPYSMKGEKLIAEEVSRAWKAVKGKRCKCIVLDLDNTLWGGVIGEDGVGGIELATSKEGARFRDLQKRLKDLKDEGIILAVVSKNNREDALAGINNHPDMLLRENDFVAIKANWEPKPINIEQLAKELNLGLDSFVFIDDNPVEREAVKIALPQVNVPDFPKDTTELEKFAIEISKECFPTLKITEEDTKKTEQYQTEQKRVELKNSALTLEDYLKSLEMKLTMHEVVEDDIARAAQMTQKTNQFNLTTRRYTEADIRKFKTSDSYKVWIGELEDKFGSYGKVVLAIAEIEGDTAKIDTFLMSCRVMGRNVEKDFLSYIETELAKVGVKKLQAEYIETAKNSVVKDFWKNMGYRQKSGYWLKTL